MTEEIEANMKASAIASDSMDRHVGKYKNPNMLHQLVLGRFLDTVARRIEQLQCSSILDFGCGEGLFLEELKKRGVSVEGILGLDVREDALVMARALHPEITFVQADVFSWQQLPASFELVMACQVLEHVYEPERFLKRLVELSSRYVLLSVPHEPWFRLLNLLRGRDILRLGNHPEHVQHWSHSSFTRFLRPHFKTLEVHCCFPFLIALGEKR